MTTASDAEMAQPDDGAIRPFDHRSFAGLDEYGRLARAIEAFAAAEHGLDLDTSAAFVAAVRDLAARRPAADPCPRCSVDRRPRFALPVAAEVDGAVVTCRYVCAWCNTAWATRFEQVTEPDCGREAT